MPRPVRFKTAAISDLLKQTRYASADVRLKQMRAAEKLAREIDREQTYPEAFIIYRITSYRPENADAILFGAALVGDLAQLVTELSKGLSIAVDAKRPALSIEALAEQWGVSTKSLSRYRHQGLICHMLVIDGTPCMACYEDEAKRFAAAHPEKLRKAAGFRRMGEGTVTAIIERARAMRQESGSSLNTVARALAQEHGRSHEAVRGLLRRHDMRSKQPIFTEPGPLSERAHRVISRAWRMGISQGKIGAHFGKSMQTIHRAINTQRIVMLKGLSISFVNLSTFGRKDAADVILSPMSVRSGLGEDERFHDAITLIATCKADGAADANTEQQQLAAYHWLKRQASEAISALEQTATSEKLDAIETQLRWASRLKRRLVEGALHAAIRAIEQALHRPLVEQPSSQVLSLVESAVATTSHAVDTFDPSRGSGLERAVGLAMGRAMATRTIADRPGRAAARHAGEALPTATLFDALNPWQAWLDLPWRSRVKVVGLDAEAKQVVQRIIGLRDEEPMTVAEAARDLGMTKSHAARVLREAMASLRRAAGAGTL